MAEDEKQTELQHAWGASVEFTEIPPGSVERALFRGYNICVKFPEALIAAYHTVEAGVEVSAAVTTHLNWPSAILKCYRAALSVFSSLVESMKPLSYITAVVLSTHKEGIDEPRLRDEVNRFLDEPKTRTLSWHLGTSATTVDEARGDRGDPDWLSATVRDLDSKGFLTRNGDKLFPRQKNVEWKIGF
jgi:hypothetical protein